MKKVWTLFIGLIAAFLITVAMVGLSDWIWKHERDQVSTMTILIATGVGGVFQLYARKLASQKWLVLLPWAVFGSLGLLVALGDRHLALTGVVPVAIFLAYSLTPASHFSKGSVAELMKAAAGGDAATVRALVAKGANVNAKTEYGETALALATLKGHQEVADILKAAGAKE